MATFNEANDEILTVFRDAWQPRAAVYENVDGSKPTDVTSTWARAIVRHFTGNQDSLIGGLVRGNPPTVTTVALGVTAKQVDPINPKEKNVRRYRHGGLFTAQIFVPIGKGLMEGYELAKLVSDAFEGTDTPSDVWFRNVRLREIGPDGEWFQINVLADFEYTEVK